MGEGVARVHDLRREEGQHVVGHVVVEEDELLIGEPVLAHLADALAGQQAVEMLVGFLVVGVQLVAPLVDGVELLGGGHAGLRVDDGLLQQRQVAQGAHAHHEELLEVAPEDGDEVQTLQQGHRGVSPLIKYALVEIEPGQLAVLHIGGLRHIGGSCCVLRCLLGHESAPPLSLTEKSCRTPKTCDFYILPLDSSQAANEQGNSEGWGIRQEVRLSKDYSPNSLISPSR